MFISLSPAVWCKLTKSLTECPTSPLTEGQGQLPQRGVSHWALIGQEGDRPSQPPEPWAGDLSAISGLVDKTDPVVPQLQLSLRNRCGVARSHKTHTHTDNDNTYNSHTNTCGYCRFWFISKLDIFVADLLSFTFVPFTCSHVFTRHIHTFRVIESLPQHDVCNFLCCLQRPTMVLTSVNTAFWKDKAFFFFKRFAYSDAIKIEPRAIPWALPVRRG